jgi:hypothetical protein
MDGIPAVRYLQTYTKDDPPPSGNVAWSPLEPLVARYVRLSDYTGDLVAPPSSDVEATKAYHLAVGREMVPEGDCLLILGTHVVGREDTE